MTKFDDASKIWRRITIQQKRDVLLLANAFISNDDLAKSSRAKSFRELRMPTRDMVIRWMINNGHI
jgi:hypothetical protein